MNANEAYKKIISPVNCKYGAPLGRCNVGSEPVTITRGNNGRICKCDQVKVYDKRVPLIDGAYDKGGVYWGSPDNLRVRFTKDLTFIQFYRI